MRKKIKEVEDYRKELDRDTKSKRGNFRILPRGILNSRAFAELNKAGIIVTLAMLDKLSYEKKGSKSRKGNSSVVGKLVDDKFVLTNNELKARGLKSSEAIAKGRREAWNLGFFDVVKSGTVVQHGQFRYSNRWTKYPDGDYLPKNQPPPGKCLYPKTKSKLTPENAVNATLENDHREDDIPTPKYEVKEEDVPTSKTDVY